MSAVKSPLIKPPTVLESWITRQQLLLKKEREAEEEQTKLLREKTSQKLLEKKGLALGNLGVSSVDIGLGGKT